MSRFDALSLLGGSLISLCILVGVIKLLALVAFWLAKFLENNGGQL